MNTQSANNDSDILDLIKVGDNTGFDLMVERYAPMLYRYAIRMCHDEAMAEDSLQDTFLTAQEKIGQFRGDGKLRNWLFRITGNSCLQKHRKNKGRVSSELSIDEIYVSNEDRMDSDIKPWQLDPAEQLLSSELRKKLDESIAKIPATNRSVLLLRDIEGLSTREAAQALDISETAVKVRLHRARAFVRNQLMDYFEEK
jgi:RNA polymerase sigma-70 factor, ECF subfamily